MDFMEFAESLIRDSIIYVLAVTTIITLALTVRALTVKRSVKNEIPPLMDEGEAKQEILPLPDENELEQVIPLLPDEGELKQEIRPLLEERTSESCEYCAIFKDLGTMVCPNCGRPLNLRLP